MRAMFTCIGHEGQMKLINERVESILSKDKIIKWLFWDTFSIPQIFGAWNASREEVKLLKEFLNTFNNATMVGIVYTQCPTSFFIMMWNHIQNVMLIVILEFIEKVALKRLHFSSKCSLISKKQNVHSRNFKGDNLEIHEFLNLCPSYQNSSLASVDANLKIGMGVYLCKSAKHWRVSKFWLWMLSRFSP